MEQIRVETTSSPEIIITEVLGSLRLRGWDRDEVRADASEDEAMKIDKSGNKVLISATAGMVIRIPNSSSIQIDTVHGESLVQSVEGDIDIKRIIGQLTLKNNVGKTTVQTVEGPFSAKQIEGNLTVKKVQGTVSMRDVEGEINMPQIQGAFNFRGISLAMDVTCEDTAIVRLETDPGGRYKVTAKGSIRCKLEPGTSADIKLHSDAKFMRIKVPDTSLKLEETDYEFTLGDGESSIELNAGGPIEIKAYSDVDEFGEEFEARFEAGFEEEVSQMAEDISTQVTEQIEVQMSHLNERLAHLSVNLGPLIDDSKKREKVERKIEQAMRKVEQKTEKAARKAERQTRAAMARNRRDRYRRRLRGDDPVSDTERQMILQMLAENKINVADAETLMGALDGKKNPAPPVPPAPPAPPAPPVAPVPPVPPVDELED